MRFAPNACCCGGSGGDHATLFTARDLNFSTTDAESTILRCTRCASIFPALFPTSESISEAYRGYYTSAPPLRRDTTFKSLLNATRRDYLARSLPKRPLRLLDFGCGGGEYLRHVRDRFPAVSRFGTDVAPPGERVEGFEWIPLDRIDGDHRRFDWITMSHVVEHLPDPVSTVQALAQRLDDDGGLWLATPNAGSFLIAAFGPWARDIDFPRHRQVFSRRSLVLCLEKAGLSVSECNPPRLNAILNFASCAKNVVRDERLGIGEKVRLLSKGAIHLATHLLKPAARRMAEAPELVIIASVHDVRTRWRRPFAEPSFGSR